MKLMDCVEVIVEKNKYAKEGVHKGMQGVIWEPVREDGAWVVLIPQCGEKEDIADLYIDEEDLLLLPDGMDARINEQIKAQFDNAEKAGNDSNGIFKECEDISDYMV